MMSLFYSVRTDGKRRRRKIPWQALLAVAVVAVCGAMLYRMNRQLDRDEQRRAELVTEAKAFAAQPAPKPVPEVPIPTNSLIAPTAQTNAAKTKAPLTMPTEEVLMPQEVRKAFDEASAVLSRAVQFSATESLSTLVRHPDITLPRCRAWSASRPMTPMVPLQIGPKFGTMEKLMVTTLRMHDGSARPVVMEKTATSYLLDWESLVGWGECFFKDVPKLPQGQRTLLRVTVKPSSALPPFTQEPGTPFILSHPNERMTLTAHATDSMLAQSKTGQLLRAAADAPFTLRIAVDADCLKHGWVRIEEVVCSGWVTDL